MSADLTAHLLRRLRQVQDNLGLGPHAADGEARCADAAALHRREMGFIVWGIEDGTKAVLGTTFQPRKAKKGAEELENGLMRSLHPQVHFRMHEWSHEGHPLVQFEIPRATHTPVRFGSEEFIRVGSLKKKLREHPTKEKELWASFDQRPSEQGIARENVPGDEVLALLDFADCFDLKVPLWIASCRTTDGGVSPPIHFR